jgi:hypothetical protein
MVVVCRTGVAVGSDFRCARQLGVRNAISVAIVVASPIRRLGRGYAGWGPRLRFPEVSSLAGAFGTILKGPSFLRSIGKAGSHGVYACKASPSLIREDDPRHLSS